VAATRGDGYLDYFQDAGFGSLGVLARVDYFARSPSDETREVAGSFGVIIWRRSDRGY
jgi:hypothetical protein